MEEMELICFKIISAVGEAKSDYISALEAAKREITKKQKRQSNTERHVI